MRHNDNQKLATLICVFSTADWRRSLKAWLRRIPGLKCLAK